MLDSKYCRVKGEAIRPTANAWPKLGHATQRAEQQQLYNTMAENSKNQSVAVTKKSRPLTERPVGLK